MQLLNESVKRFIIDKYTQHRTLEISYATVRDFCDSADYLPQICHLDADLKNVQRPWIIKAILGEVPLGGRLLEIGGGVPLVAGMLTELGYRVTLVDPYEGAGNGPTEYKRYVQEFPEVNIMKTLFGTQVQDLDVASFDCIYSVSVLEHIPQASIKDIYDGIRKFLCPKGKSIHCIDHVIQGLGAEYHEESLKIVLLQQKQLYNPDCKLIDIANEYESMMNQLKNDLETFYLSALGHHLWRGGLSYDEFPFRKVVSIQTCVSVN